MYRPVLFEVNEYLMEVFGYAIAPINYGTHVSIRENSSIQINCLIMHVGGIKELVLININNNPITSEAVLFSY